MIAALNTAYSIWHELAILAARPGGWVLPLLAVFAVFAAWCALLDRALPFSVPAPVPAPEPPAVPAMHESTLAAALTPVRLPARYDGPVGLHDEIPPAVPTVNPAPPVGGIWAFNAAACALAQCLWYSRAQAFRLEVPSWETVEPTTRGVYIDQAAHLLSHHRPMGVPDPLIRSRRADPSPAKRSSQPFSQPAAKGVRAGFMRDVSADRTSPLA